MEILDLVALFLSVIGVQLTSTKFIPYLKPTGNSSKKEKIPLEIVGTLDGPIVGEKLEHYVERRHEVSTSRVGSSLILLSVVVQQIPIPAKVTYSRWWFFAILLLATLLLAGLLAWEVSEHRVKKIKNEAKRIKDSWGLRLE